MSTEPEVIQTQVCIIGAGPAGTSASLFLSKQGIPHVLVDKENFPREKVCGEYFDGRVVAVLKRIDPALQAEMLDKNVLQQNRRYALVGTHDRPFCVTFPGEKTARLQAARRDFDAFLLEKALETGHCRFLGGHTVFGLEKNPRGFFLVKSRFPQPQIEAKMLLMACGSDSLLPHRFLGDERGEGSDFFLFMRAHYRLRAQLEANTVFTCIATKPFNHCFYVCPLPGNRVNVEIAADKKAWLRGGKPDLRGVLAEQFLHHPVFKNAFAGAELLAPPRGTAMHLYHPARRFSGDGFLLAGEIAFSSNPITGAGVGQAMTMGMHAGLAAAEAVRAGDFSAKKLAGYDQTVRRLFKNDFRTGKMLTLLQRYPAIIDLGLRILTLHPAIERGISRLAGRLA